MFDEILRLKGLTKPIVRAGEAPKIDNARIQELTSVPTDQITHYLKGRQPGPDALRKLADGLELDGNFVLGSTYRSAAIDLPHALTHMALDRYIQHAGIEGEDADELRYLADMHPELPMWEAAWRQIHESLKLVRRRGSLPVSPSPRPYQARRPRRRDGQSPS